MGYVPHNGGTHRSMWQFASVVVLQTRNRNRGLVTKGNRVGTRRALIRLGTLDAFRSSTFDVDCVTVKRKSVRACRAMTFGIRVGIGSSRTTYNSVIADVSKRMGR
jgi:hypothetical protein